MLLSCAVVVVCVRGGGCRGCLVAANGLWWWLQGVVSARKGVVGPGGCHKLRVVTSVESQ